MDPVLPDSGDSGTRGLVPEPHRIVTPAAVAHSDTLRPFPGLTPFEERDAWLFRGREEEIRVITANLQASRLTLLYGDSGCGKSSLLNAGVAYNLREQSRLHMERWKKPEFIVIGMRNWLGDPLALFANEAQTAAPGAKITGSSLESVLSAIAAQADRAILILLDQFEEYFRYLSDDRSDPAFLEQFEAIWKTDLPVNFLLSMREDSLGLLDRLKGKIPNPFDNYLRLEHLSIPGATDAILSPITSFNRAHGTDIRFDPKLAGKVIEKIVQRPLVLMTAQDRVQPSILQLVLTRWWDRQMALNDPVFKEQVLDNLGGIKNIVGDHVRETLASGKDLFKPEQAASVFVPLVTESGRKIANTDREIAGSTGLSVDEVRRVTDLLEKKRILSVVPLPPKANPEDICYEFAHDLLAEAALEWRKGVERDEARREAQAKERAARESAESERTRANQLRTYLTIALCALVAALCAIAFGIYNYRNATRQAQRAENQAQLATSRHLAAQSDLIFRDRSAGLDISTLLAIESFRRQPLFENDLSLRRNMSLVHRAPRDLQHASRVQDAVFSPNGALVATAGEDNTARLWYTATGQLYKRLPHKGKVRSAAFSPDGKLLATASTEGFARLWDTSSGGEVCRLKHDGEVRSVAFSADGRFAASGSNDKTARIWDTRTCKEYGRITHGLAVVAVRFSPNGKWLATASSDKTARIWSVGEKRDVATLHHNDRVVAVDFSKDSRLLATASWDHTAGIWDASSGARIGQVEHSDTVWAVSFGPNGRLATGGDDGNVRVRDIASQREAVRLPVGSEILCLAFSPSGDTIAVGGSQGGSLWDLSARKELARLPHNDTVRAIAFSPDGSRLITASWDSTARLWEAKPDSGALPITQKERILAVAFTPDGKLLGTGGSEGSVVVRDLASSAERARFALGKAVLTIAFSQNGRFIITGGKDQVARVYDLQTREEIGHYTHGSSVIAVAIHPDGQSAVSTAASDNTAVAWTIPSGEKLFTMDHQDAVVSVAFTRDGRHVGTAGADGWGRVWETGTHKMVREVRHLEQLSGIAFSPDGKMIVTSSSDRTAAVWDMDSGKQLAKLPHRSRVQISVFSPDGQMIATSGADKAIHVWDWNRQQELHRAELELTTPALFWPDAKSIIGASLTADERSLSVQVHPLRPDDLVKAVCAKLTRNLNRQEWGRYLPGLPYRRTCENLPEPAAAAN